VFLYALHYLYIILLYHDIWLGLINLNLSLFTVCLNNKNDTALTLHACLFDMYGFIKNELYTTPN
jgi:hypothetical protein